MIKPLIRYPICVYMSILCEINFRCTVWTFVTHCSIIVVSFIGFLLVHSVYSYAYAYLTYIYTCEDISVLADPVILVCPFSMLQVVGIRILPLGRCHGDGEGCGEWWCLGFGGASYAILYALTLRHRWTAPSFVRYMAAMGSDVSRFYFIIILTLNVRVLVLARDTGGGGGSMLYVAVVCDTLCSNGVSLFVKINRLLLGCLLFPLYKSYQGI